MSEIEKMYENAGIDYEERYNSCTLNKEGQCELKCSCDICKYSEEKYIFPLLTAEKQIELIKWLGKLDGKLEITCTYNKEKFIFNFYFNRKTDKNPDPKYPYSNFLNADIEILIASIINDIWQDLTEEEKQQVKGILE